VEFFEALGAVPTIEIVPLVSPRFSSVQTFLGLGFGDVGVGSAVGDGAEARFCV
jgi:hypothetical protein